MNKIVLCFALLFSVNVFAAEADAVAAEVQAEQFTGTVYIAPRFLYRTPLHRDDTGIFELNPIIKVEGVTYSEETQAYQNYPKPYLGRRCCSAYEYSDYFEEENRSAEYLEYYYLIMPQYIKDLVKREKLFIFVEIVLKDGKNIFEKNTFCYLPLSVFKNKDNSFKQADDAIEFTMHFKDYEGQFRDYKFTLILDDEFNNIKRIFDEFVNESKHVAVRTKHCFGRAFKKLYKTLGEGKSAAAKTGYYCGRAFKKLARSVKDLKEGWAWEHVEHES